MVAERSLSRRRYLALTGSGLSVFAGCSGGSADQDERTTTAATETATQSPTPTSQPTETETPTPTQGRSAAVTQMESQLASVSFDGEYFDTHAHWLPSMGPDIPSTYAPVMDEYDVGATVLFSPSAQAAQNYESFLERLTDPGVEYLPFMSAPPPGRQLGSELRALYEDKPDAFWGIGEWKPQNKPFPPFDGPRYTKLWELSADLDVPVMFHPKPSQEGTVEPALQAHPDATFILHGSGPGLGPTLPRLLREYDNLYWQMDVGVMFNGVFLRLRSASEFIDWYESNASDLITSYQRVLPKLLDAAPKRVMWGTDIAKPWNLDDEVFSRVMTFTEEVLEGVPEKHHAAYKHENALRLFGL
jgi:predicted TIM-barrel fold metal-dependent hydrolase